MVSKVLLVTRRERTKDQHQQHQHREQNQPTISPPTVHAFAFLIVIASGWIIVGSLGSTKA